MILKLNIVNENAFINSISLAGPSSDLPRSNSAKVVSLNDFPFLFYEFFPTKFFSFLSKTCAKIIIKVSSL